MREQLLPKAPPHFGEDRCVGRVASKIMIKLAGAVIVAGSCGKQPEAFRQHPQPSPGFGIMILMVDFDAVQPVITHEVLKHIWREQALAAPPPGVRDHREPAGLVHEVDATIYLDRVAVNVGWTAVGQEAVECLLPITNMACRYQRIGDVRATHRGAVADLGHYLGFADRHPKRSQLAEYASEPTEPAVTDTRHFGGQPRTYWISAVRQDVHTAAATRAGELHSADHTKPEPFSLGHCFIEAVEGVVISQRNDIETDGERLAHQLSWRVRPVGDRGVRMQVNPHISRPTTHRPVSCLLSFFAVGVVQVGASQGRRGRDTGSYVDRGERREVRAWAARTVERLRRHDAIGILVCITVVKANGGRPAGLPTYARGRLDRW
jgi:hypothetical protein